MANDLTNTPPVGRVSTVTNRLRTVRTSNAQRGAGVQQHTPIDYVQPGSTSTWWNGYDYSKPPKYPDTSYSAYLSEGGNALGLGYFAWRDKKIGNYNTAYNLYKQHYDSTPEQIKRIEAAGLNTNLAYGMASPGGSAGEAFGGTNPPSPAEVAVQGVQAVSGLAGGLKTLVETASMLYELPESKFKGNLARSLNVAAAAQAYNAGKTWEGQLAGARISAGVAGSQAKREHSQNLLGSAQAQAETSLLNLLTSTDPEGNESDFEGSIYARSGAASKNDIIISYQKHQKEWHELLSKPQYWKAMLDKAVADSDISKAQAWKVNTILNADYMSDAEKLIALQEGVPGFIAKIMFEWSQTWRQNVSSKLFPNLFTK